MPYKCHVSSVTCKLRLFDVKPQVSFKLFKHKNIKVVFIIKVLMSVKAVDPFYFYLCQLLNA